VESAGVEPQTSPIMEIVLEKAAQLACPHIVSYHITFPLLFKFPYGIVGGGSGLGLIPSPHSYAFNHTTLPHGFAQDLNL